MNLRKVLNPNPKRDSGKLFENRGAPGLIRTGDLLLRSFWLVPYIADSFSSPERFLRPSCVSAALIEPLFEPKPLFRSFVLSRFLSRKIILKDTVRPREDAAMLKHAGSYVHKLFPSEI